MFKLIISYGDRDYDWYHGHFFADAANGVDKTTEPDFFDIIQQSFWRDCHPQRQPGSWHYDERLE